MVHLSFLPFSISAKILNLEEGWQCSQVIPASAATKGGRWYTCGSNQKGHPREQFQGRLAKLGGAAPLPLALPSASWWTVDVRTGAPTAISVHEAALTMEMALKTEEPKSRILFPIIRWQSSHIGHGFLSSTFPSYEREINLNLL